MRPQEIISKKRDGQRLTDGEIAAFISGVTDGSWADYQTSALLMAMYLNDLDSAEQAFITQAMLNSGRTFDFSDIDKPKADKHSTGGVGDKTSLIIAPILASCGVAVPMISGRGLGHTGGTLDKLESIPGYSVNLDEQKFRRIVRECGYAMTGQTADIAPADRKIYALRDATATVSSLPLMVASIMSKKLAEGLDCLVLDVKTGSGAFMADFEDSKRLAEAMVHTGNACGVKTRALITDMNEPLGRFVGNALEVYECLKVLRGDSDPGTESMTELSIQLASRALVMSGIVETDSTARKMIDEKIANGDVLEKFRANVSLQGGDARICDQPGKLLDPTIRKREIRPNRAGYLSAVNTTAIGNAICSIGGGRRNAEDTIDFQVGLEQLAKIGDAVTPNEPLALIYFRDKSDITSTLATIANAYQISPNPVKKESLVKVEIG